MVALGTVAACEPGDGAERQSGCAATVREASSAAEVADQIRLLDTALVACRSYAALTAELARYPGIVGYDLDTFVEKRCTEIDDEAVRAAPACRTVAAPTTVVARTTVPELVFVGQTLDGREIEIRPSERTRFVGEIPEYVQQTVDILFESGCEGVLAQRDFWAALVDDPETGDEASVYAQHAQNVADYVGCESTPIP